MHAVIHHQTPPPAPPGRKAFLPAFRSIGRVQDRVGIGYRTVQQVRGVRLAGGGGGEDRHEE